jgi:hypothetical protein
MTSSAKSIRNLSPAQQLERANPDLKITPEIRAKLDKLIQFFEETGIKYDKFVPAIKQQIGKKTSYPNYDQYMHIPGQHNLPKWLQTVQQLYRMEQAGHSRVQAIRQATAQWNPMETYDFLHWLRYYEEGTHLKYKMAQLWYENGAPGYFLHIKPDPPKEPEPIVSGQEIDFAKDQAVDDSEKRHTIEKQRNKIIGRLDSAEKLLRSPAGQTFAGPELEALMEAVYQLKKKIQLVNKLSTSTRLYEDMIIRQANVLHRDGFGQAASWLYAQAQANNPPPHREIGQTGPLNILPPPQAPESPSAPLHPGAPGGLPSMGPGMPQNAPAGTGVPEVGPNDTSPTNLKGVTPPSTQTTGNGVPTPLPQSEPPTGIAEFLERMNEGDNDQALDDSLEINDVIDVADSDDELLVTEAQIAPLNEPLTTTPAPTRGTPMPEVTPVPKAPKLPKQKLSKPEPLDVKEEDISTRSQEVSKDVSNFDHEFDAIFANLTVDDAVAKLEDLAKIFKVREVPRQLAIVDIMLSKLDLSSMFPSLAEAQNKALESNNYISTRVEDILSKLRGAMSSKSIDLRGGPERADTSGIKNKLTQDAEKEKQRKQQRKEQADAELAGSKKETPEVEIEEDLGAKPPVPQPPTVPVVPPV